MINKIINVELIDAIEGKRIPNMWHRMIIKYISNFLIIAKDYPDGVEVPFVRSTGKEWNGVNCKHYLQITEKSLRNINQKQDR